MGFKETYEAIKEDISKGEKNFNVKCEMMNEGLQCKTTMGASNHEFIIDAPAGLDGTDEGPSPLLAILSAIGACIIAVTRFWAKIMDIEVEEMTVHSRGHINLAAIFGLDDDLLPGYDKLEPVIRIKANAPKEKVQEMMDKVLSHCPVITNFGGASPIQPKVQIK
ncbi:MAG: putative OsmC family protein [Promethearchaeota archaeon]|nr:MAG: putative OsmC family protein [Candidatus Lokiarchaeota archaeon]